MSAPIDFYFDFSSPYAYIASEWIEGVAARHGRTVNWKPVLLGPIFQAAQLKSPVSHPNKREYSLRDFARSARFERLPFVMPATFPLATHNAARVFWWLHDQHPEKASAWVHACFRAVFGRGEDLGEVPVLKALCESQGLDAEAAEQVWNDTHWKDRLREANEEALAAGVFGAPFFVIDGEPFWGNDRKTQIEAWLKQPF